MFKTALNNANTSDIIYSMAIIAPAAIKQAQNNNLPEIIGLTGGDVNGDAILTGQWIRANIKYKVDPFTDQNIQLPSALLRDKIGDCKSFSMLFLAIMEAAGYNGGFRFAAYRNKNFTHVYNYFLDNNNNLFTFDACIKGLKENQSYTKIKDMRINYIAGAPVMINENNKKNKMREVPLKLLMQDDRYANISGIGRKKLFPKLNKFIQKGKNAVKTVGMAPARGSFLVLLNQNYKGLATKLDQALAKNPKKVSEFWVKLGGDTNKLKKAINKGKTKKAKGIFGISEGETGAEGGGGLNFKEIGEAAGAASGIIGVVLKLLKSLGIGKKDKKDPLADDAAPDGKVHPDLEPGEDFFANDPATPEAQKYAESGGELKPKSLEASANFGSFKPSPLLIGGAAAAVIGIYLLTKKKK
jgi:hypothetical protein